MTATTRVERDSMGTLDVPAEALWGAQTQRALQNFPASGLRMPRAFIRALALIKQSAARRQRRARRSAAGHRHGHSRRRRSRWRPERCDEQFPIDVFQTGSGTSSNMNANEVIAAWRRDPWARRCTRTIRST